MSGLRARGSLLVLLLAALPAALLALHPIDSADVWFQLATGEWMTSHRGLPPHDPFGSLPPDRPWIVHDWLALLGMQFLFRLGGAPALVLVTALLLLAALGLPAVLAWRRREPLLPYAAALLISTCIAYERFFVRPEVCSLVLASIFACALARGAPATKRAAAGFFAAQVAWTNMHGAFVLGPVFAALAAAADAIRARWLRQGWPGGLTRWRLGLPLLLVLACLVTPYGPRLLLRILAAGRELGAEDLRRGIVEWQPTFSQPIAGDFVLMSFVASLVGLAIAALLCRRHIRLFEALLGLVSIALAVSSRRHLALYALLVPPVGAAWVSRVLVSRPAGLWRQAVALACGLLSVVFAFDVARGAFYRRCGPPRTLGVGLGPGDAPVGAGEFVAQHALPGPLFNNISAGSYLVWRMRGDPPVLVDGRLLDPLRFRDYRRSLESMREFDAFVGARGIRTVVLGLQPFPPVQLFRHLYSSGAWRLAYFDAAGAVFLPDSLLSARGLSSVTLDAGLPAAGSPTGEAGPGWRECDPGEAARRGDLLLRLGYASAARADLERALLHCPSRWDLGLSLATALIATGRAPEARPLVERALEHDPLNVDAWLNAGHVCRAAGDAAGARHAWQRAASLAPSDPRPVRLLRDLTG